MLTQLTTLPRMPIQTNLPFPVTIMAPFSNPDMTVFEPAVLCCFVITATYVTFFSKALRFLSA